MINCFFDSLQPNLASAKPKLGGGCVRVKNCIEVHVRNTLARVGATWASCVWIAQSDFDAAKAYRVEVPWQAITTVALEGTSLEVVGGSFPGYSALRLDPQTRCLFRHSSADSIAKSKQAILESRELGYNYYL